MYDKGKILAGLVIFFGVLSYPFWYTVASGNAGYYPEVEKAAHGTECFRDKQEMISTHMELLNEWRDEVVREGKREQITIVDKKYDKSLTNACLYCHENKDKFCDQCHNYLGVDPFCWDCHVDPKEFN
jgi:hypothetical protein